jgi:7-cyano-7-deazaguanine synthase in queuosine biosynthesis
MRVLCAPLDTGFKDGSPRDLEVVLYGYADRQRRGEAGANIREVIRRLELRPAARAWDFLSIALAVLAADTGVRRDLSPDGWTREIELEVAVADPKFWNAKREILHQALRFLTTDIWAVNFLRNGLLPAPPKKPKMPDEDCVALLSGGLDSLVGVLDLHAAGRKPYVVSQVATGDKKKQAYFASKIGDGLSHLQLNHVINCPGENERSQRARSLIFLAYGVLLATATKQSQLGKSVTLYVCENGFISINPPMTPTRIGSLSTRTTHPVYLALVQRLLDEAGLQVKLVNPYQFKTKGAMLSGCAQQDFLVKHASWTTSCGRYARNGFKHCGRCVPCLIRRASFHASSLKDRTEYVYRDLSKQDSDHAAFDDVRAALMAVGAAKAEGVDAWLGSSLTSVFIQDTKPYRAVAARGLNEIEAYLKSADVS